MKKKIIISLLTFLLIVSCVNIIPSKVFAEEEPFTFESVLDECAELTATDELEGVVIGERTPTIKDFKGNKKIRLKSDCFCSRFLYALNY